MEEIIGLEELGATNVGFRFLCQKDQTQSGAILFLQWCLAPQVVQYLREKKVLDARVFITIRDPRGRETRGVAPLTSPQELLEFHCPGLHKISGTVVWGSKDTMKLAEKRFLKKDGRYYYENDMVEVMGRSGVRSFGRAELSAEVADGFFAPKLSPSEEWYINLWCSEPAWDECAIRKRRLLAYTIQPIPVALWVFCISAVRLICAFWLSVMLLKKDVLWGAVIRPFSCDTEDVWRDSEKRFEGKPFLRLLLVPLNQIALLFVSFFLGGIIMNIIGWSPLAFLACLVSAYVVIVGIAVAILMLPRLFATETWKRWGQREKEEEIRRLSLLYSDLVCTTAPADGALRARRQGLVNNTVLAYHGFKARVCRPAARG